MRDLLCVGYTCYLRSVTQRKLRPQQVLVEWTVGKFGTRLGCQQVQSANMQPVRKTELQIAVSPAVPTPAIGHMSGPRTQPIVDPPEPATTAHGAPRDAYAWPLVGAIHFVHPKTPAEKRWPTSSRASRS